MFIKVFFMIAIIGLLWMISFYFGIGILVNCFSSLLYGKKNYFGWLPFYQIYLLGKLAVNQLFGRILAIGGVFYCLFIFSINVNGFLYNVILSVISFNYISLYSIVIFVFYFYAIFKYRKLKKLQKNKQ